MLKKEKRKVRQTVADLNRRNSELEQQNEELRAQLAKMQQRVAELEARLALNSSNSSRPPSTDSPDNGKKRNKKQKKGNRKRGGQPGHKRNERKLVPESEVAEITELKPERCRRCDNRLGGSDPTPHRHQVVEIPPIQPTVTEWKLHSLECEHCGTKTRAELPTEVPTGSFGPRLQSLVAICSGVYRLSKRKTRELLRDVCGVEISLGSISNLERQTSEALVEPVREVRQHAQEQPIVHADETSWKQQGRKMWLWMMATASVAVFLIRPSRSKKVAKELLGDFDGILVSDRYGSYNFIESDNRQICWAHLLRNIEAFRSWGLGAKRLATQIQRPMRKMLRLYHRARDGLLSSTEFHAQANTLKLDILFQLRRGSTWKLEKIAGVCRSILKLESALFTFLDHEGVEPTNNHAERLLRHPVLWRKTSFGTDSDNGNRFVERILTTVMTLRLQKRNALEYVTQACIAQQCSISPPSLIPT